MLNPNHKHQNYQFFSHEIDTTLINLIGYVVNVCFGSNHSSSIKTTPIFGTIKIQKHAYPVKQSELSDYFLKPFFCLTSPVHGPTFQSDNFVFTLQVQDGKIDGLFSTHDISKRLFCKCIFCRKVTGFKINKIATITKPRLMVYLPPYGSNHQFLRPIMIIIPGP